MLTLCWPDYSALSSQSQTICPASSFCKTNNKEEEEEEEKEDDQQHGEKLLDLASPFSAALLQIVATVTRGGLD